MSWRLRHVDGKVTDTGNKGVEHPTSHRSEHGMTLTLKPLQAITNAPVCYDYSWMKTVVDNIAVDEKGRPCRLVQNEDEWHFRQQLLRYGSGLNLAIDRQDLLDDYIRHGWLRLSDTPVRIHRIRVALHQALDWEDGRRDALLTCLDQWQDGPNIKYTTGHRMDYYLECRGDEAAQRVRENLRGFGLEWESWGPQPE
jgi:hypothetical protein